MKKSKADAIVIGAGASGMMAAASAAEAGADVLLFEHSRMPGMKLRITGKGRCNLTNRSSINDLLENIPHNSCFLRSSLHRFSQENTIDYFESLGLPLKTERGNRVFPVSDKAADVVETLRKHLDRLGVVILYEHVDKVNTEDGIACGVQTSKGIYFSKTVILATGGISYSRTGSDGSGLHLSRTLGHRITELEGSLVPLVEDGELCAEMQGLSLKNIAIRVIDESNKVIYSDFGELIFTHFGLSGPVILSASAHIPDNVPMDLFVDLKPALDEQTLERRILRDLEENKNKTMENILSLLLPRLMIPVILSLAEISPSTKANSLTKQQRKKLLSYIKSFPIRIKCKRPIDEAIVTRGGVSIDQIDPKTMESKIIKQLFFAGEMIDVDAYTGGYNLQIAWTTGKIAGQSAAEICLEDMQ